MKIGFVFNSRFTKYKEHYYSINFDKEMWENRYLKNFDEIIVVGYQTKVENNPEGKLVRSDCEKVRFSCIPETTKLGRIIHYKNDMNFIENAIKDCDAVILRGWWGVSVCQKLKKPYMIEVVNCAWDALWNHSILGKLVAVPNYLLQKKAIRKAPYVLYVTKKFLQKRYPTKGISCGISDVKLYGELSDNILKSRLDKIDNSSGRKLIIGTAAAVNVKYKGQKYVIKALVLLKKRGMCNYEYQMAGSGNQERLQKYAKRMGVSENIKFLGPVPKEGMRDWFDSIDIYIQPSFQEGLPRSVVEAMSRAIPCIGSDVGGIPELLQSKYICRRKRNFAKQIAEKLILLDKNALSEAATYSFNKAKEFAPQKLDATRYEFYEKFAQQCR